MAIDKNDKTVSSTDTGFPEYLNFEKLRSEAIAYLGELSGKIWTDHNVHDPGVTILEALIYAVLDLGYRTNLPTKDIFARNPSDTSADDNFLTPSQILVNNPFTITDFRKLLIDIAGVKNAWLEVENKLPVDFCENDDEPGDISFIGAPLQTGKNPCECEFLNGLYHVFVELEKEFDLKDPAQAKEYDLIIEKIKCALMAHRNLCEDFLDIKILCKLKIGLCADIELSDEADVGRVLSQAISALRDFFSPSPKFYTLQQMVDKGKSIGDIFAGRPYNITESHGFTDAEELEAITLKKVIHLSDVYQILFGVKGVKSVRNLKWNLCSDDAPLPVVDKWQLRMPQNHIPEFDITCSGFQFFKYGLKVNVQPARYGSLLAINSSGNGKILYSNPSPYLDHEIPQGIYRHDLAVYKSIQNDFPAVYGIRNGDLPSGASSRRQAQALQLQGFLLFFDQLLANYLSQLQNIRSLFAMRSPLSGGHTYFTNDLTDVPQMDKLFRFPAGAAKGSTFGSEGSVLAYPVNKETLGEMISTGTLDHIEFNSNCKDNIPPFLFCYDANREQAEIQLRDDLLYGEYKPVIVSNTKGEWFFYWFSSAKDFALLSKKSYCSYAEAQVAAASVQYLGTFEENYRTFTTREEGNDYFSFDIELNLNTYSKYLKLISESDELFGSRRQGFLNHLLSRFAETFTDFALLTGGFLSNPELQKSQIKAEERYLEAYPELSSNRGKAYDYHCGGWNNENTSGFEKKVKALAGIDNWKRHSLCNFVVVRADEVYELSISLFGDTFRVENKMVTHEAGYASVSSLFRNLKESTRFEEEYLEPDQKWSVYIQDDLGNKYRNEKLFETAEAATSYISRISGIISEKPVIEDNIYVSKYVHKVRFENYREELLEESRQNYNNREEAGEWFEKIAPKIGEHLENVQEFKKIKKFEKPGKLLHVKNRADAAVYIDKSKFKSRVSTVVKLDEEKKTFVMLNEEKTIQFNSLLQFDSTRQAGQGFEDLLVSLCARENYYVEKQNGNEQPRIVIKNGVTGMAVYFEPVDEQNSQEKIEQIFQEIISDTYKLYVSEAIPDKWKFQYRLVNPAEKDIELKAITNFSSREKAVEAAQEFYNNLSSLKAKKLNQDLQLTLNHRNKVAVAAALEGEEAERAMELLKHHQQIAEIIRMPSERVIEEKLEEGRVRQQEQFVYKLVDKDQWIAQSYLSAPTREEALAVRKQLVAGMLYGYKPTGLSFGKEIVFEKRDAGTCTIEYHYLLQCSNVFYEKGEQKGKPLVLFESVQGYISTEEAVAAFWENYLLVLRKACSRSNFGDGKFIGLNKEDRDNVVVIRPELLYEFDGNVTAAIDQIISVARSYPVRYISKDRYRFSVYNRETLRYDWRSVQAYSTPQGAMHQFQFFMELLVYEGNFHVEKNAADCRYRVYLREVLAISTRTFDSVEDAWSEEGVEKFICVAQTPGGLHHYLNRANCAHSFFVACANTGLIHPCKYETPERRDKVLNKLYRASKFSFFDLLRNNDENDLLLYDLEKQELAKLFIQSRDNYPDGKCERLVEIFELVYADDHFKEREGKCYLENQHKSVVAESVAEGISLDDWKQQLRSIACYFPVYKKEGAKNTARTDRQSCDYYIQIKLPGFNDCNDDYVKPGCTGKPAEEGCDPGCYVAWNSDCCFSSCCEALYFYYKSLGLMQEYSNFKAVYECGCGDYGIELRSSGFIKREGDEPVRIPQFPSWLCEDYQPNEQQYNFNECTSEIIAVNPQRYGSSVTACNASARALQLVNDEGLHLVEHILLRPRCEEDCDCESYPRPCVAREGSNDLENICHFEWKPGGETDPCKEDETICFTPGCDPFSFIVTVALPAWPQRFRSQESKAVFEQLLYKEAPAHVLVRVLWLRPRDLSCFESYYKNWHFWLAKKMCDSDYSNCDFLEFLFNNRFTPLPNCNECIPCSCNEEQPVFCSFDKEQPCEDVTFISQINDLYCWSRNWEYGYPCEQSEWRPAPVRMLSRADALSGIDTSVENPENVSRGERDMAETDSETDSETVLPDEGVKEKVIRARNARYRKAAKAVMKTVPGNNITVNALEFLDNERAESEQYADVVNKILKNKPQKAKEIPGLTMKQKNILIDAVSWHYFDSVCMYEKDVRKIIEHEALYNHLRRNKIDMKTLYEKWNGEELKIMASDINFNEIKKVVT